MDRVATDWSDEPLSRLAFGCELLGGTDWGKVDLDETAAAVHTALDLGVNVFDTADVYGLGHSEERLAAILGRHIHEVVVVTKGGVAWQTGRGGRAVTRRDLGPAYLRGAVVASLKRLGLERIPLYLAHWPDGRNVDEVVGTLEGLRTEGLIGAFGLSNFAELDVLRPTVASRISAVELEHSLVSSSARQIQTAVAAGLSTLTYGPLAQGLLTGRYAAGHRFGSDDRRHRLPHFGTDFDQHRAALIELEEVAAQAHRSMAQVAVRWALESAPTTCVVVGGRRPAQLLETAAGISQPLPPWALKRLSKAASVSA